MDLGCAPACILKRHPSDERKNLVTYPWPTATRRGPPPPVQTPARCQPTTVSGLTIARTSDQRGQSCRKVVQKKRSQWVSTGRGRFRFKMATCCLSARTSKEVSTRLRKKTRMVTTNVEIKSSTNPFL